MLKFNITDNNYIKHQDFSIPSPIVRYLMFNVDSSSSLKKLYKTCKFFYARLGINVVDSLCIDNELYISDPQPYDIDLYPNQQHNLPNKIWLTGYLLLGDKINLSLFFFKLYRCDLYEVYLAVDTKFTMKELRILTQSKTIKQIDIDMKIYIYAEENTVAPLEDVMACLLSAHSISMGICHFTKNTMKNLLPLNFQEKLKRLSLYGINLMPDANLMDEFLKKNLENRAAVKFGIANEDRNRLFREQMYEKINA